MQSPTKSNLHRRKLADNQQCPVCNEDNEDVEHLLLTYPWTRQVWFGSPLQWNPAEHRITRLDLWLQDRFKQLTINPENYDQNVTMLLTLCWHIWKGRNNAVFKAHNPQPEITISSAIASANSSFTELRKKSTPIPQKETSPNTTSRSKWFPPPERVLKENINVSFAENRNLCSIGVILRNDQGFALSGAAIILPAISPLHAESLAMKEAHELANNLSIKSIIFESDNQELITICKKPTHWKIAPIVNQIEELKCNFETVAYSWCSRNANEATDEIVTLCKNFKLSRNWVLIPPSPLQQKLLKDMDSLDSSSRRFSSSERNV